MKNIAFLCTGVQGWSPDAWKEVVVVIIADGRSKIHPNVLNVLGVHGIYMDNIEKSSVDGEDVQAHLFEFSTQVSVDRRLKIREWNDVEDGMNMVPCQTILLIKQSNAKKINSHRWFFDGICKV
jgi:chitin synthase